MERTIEIVDRGRGWQLSTTRITVQDLVPYFQEGCSYEEITRWIPTLTREEIEVVERFYREHQLEMDEQDRRIRARTEERIREQNLRPEIQEAARRGHEKMLALREIFRKRKEELERNGDESAR